MNTSTNTLNNTNVCGCNADWDSVPLDNLYDCDTCYSKIVGSEPTDVPELSINSEEYISTLNDLPF